MTFGSDFLIDLATSLACGMLEANTTRLKALAPGHRARAALVESYRAGFQAMLDDATSGLKSDQQALVADIFRKFVREPVVADTLLDMSLAGAPLPDLAILGDRFAQQFDREAFPVGFDQALTAFHRGLTEALVREASRKDSLLFNQVNLGRIIALQILLEGQARDPAAIGDRLARLEVWGGPAVYNIVIEQATGVAIGDAATVQGPLPADLQPMLAEMLAMVRELRASQRPVAYTPEDVQTYLRNLVAACEMLDLRSTGGPVERLPLERVYVALRADASNSAERRANYDQYVADLEEALVAQGDLDDRRRLQVWRRVAAGLDPLGLTLALRERGKEDREAYLTRQARQIDLGELVARERWAVLLGDPGSGKTTLIRWLALQFGRAGLAGEERVVVPIDQVQTGRQEQGKTVDLGPARLPVPVRLADYEATRWKGDHDSGLGVFEYLGQQPWLGVTLHPDRTTAIALAQDAVRQGRALILLDGLDEITDRYHRGQVVDAITRFIRTWVRDPQSGLCAAEEGYVFQGADADTTPQRQGGNQTLIASRPIGYLMAPLPGTMPHYTVEEMSQVAVGSFCRAWTAAVHAAAGQGDPRADAEALRGAILDPDRPGLAEIATNPLLLTILAGLWYTLHGQLPQRRIELYDEAVKAFLRQRPDRWAATRLRDEAFRYAMGAVANRLHASPTHPNGLAEEEMLAEWLEEALTAYEGRYYPKLSEQAGLLLESARALSGFLLERGDGVYGFVHRTFQEYFAAVYLAWDRRQVAAEVIARLDEPAWQEVLILTVAETSLRRRSTLPKLFEAILAVVEPAAGLIPRNALFLARCAPELACPAPDAAVAASTRRLVAAYADRAWPPDEDTQVPKPLRNAIEAALAGLHAQPGTLIAIGQALTGDDPAQRLAAAELILTTEWTHPALVVPLISATRTHTEPLTAIRQALSIQHDTDLSAFADTMLPMRCALAGDSLLASLDQYPSRRAILEAIYVTPKALLQRQIWTAQDVIFDSGLTPLLLQAWSEGWTDGDLAEALERLASEEVPSAVGRDAAWALAVSNEVHWHRLLALLDKGIAASALAGLTWNANSRAFIRDLARFRDLDLNLALAVERDLDPNRDCARALDHNRASNHDSELVRVGQLTRDLARDLARALDLTRDLDRNLTRDLHPDRVTNLTHQLDLALSKACALARAIDLARDFDLTSDRTRTINLAHSISEVDIARAPLDEIASILATAQARIVRERAPVDLQQALANAVRTMKALLSLRADPAWRALDSARDVIGVNMARNKAMDGEGRLMPNDALLARFSDLNLDELARLDISQIPRDESGTARRAALEERLVPWLRLPEPRRSHAVLLLAELGTLTSEHLSLLAGMLSSADDLLRYRARRVIQQRRMASSLGQAGVEILARLAENGSAWGSSYLIRTHCEWALGEVVHNRPDWLRAWAAAIEDDTQSAVAQRILGDIRWLNADAWDAFIDLLQTANPAVQDELLKSARWLVSRYGGRIEQATTVIGTLLALTAETGPIAKAARVALGHCRPVSQVTVIVATLLAQAGQPSRLTGAWTALARLASVARGEHPTEIDALLTAAPAGEEVDAALARRAVNRSKDFVAEAILAELRHRRPEPSVQLHALLRAGGDNDDWGDYHERVTATIRALMQQHSDLWSALAAELREAFAAAPEGSTAGWPRLRIALAALAACAEAMPMQFNRAARDLEALLLAATNNLGSFNARRFAVTALSYLRVVTPAVLEALLRLAGDIDRVQKDVVVAASRFNRLHPSLGQQLPTGLVEALHGPSAVRAYVAINLLEALGTSQAAQVTPGLRGQIISALAAAIQNPSSRRKVWVMKDDCIEQEGVLDQHLYRTLLRVAGF